MFARFAGAIFKVCSSLSRYCNLESAAAAVMPVDEMRGFVLTHCFLENFPSDAPCCSKAAHNFEN
jgi:hypothetical protein